MASGADPLASRGELLELGRIGLSVRDEGGDGDPLLLVHGFTGAKEDFGDWIEPLTRQGWHVVAPDLRGHGASDAPGDEAAYSLDIFTDDLVALVDHLGWARFRLLGHSMGGMLAQRLALRMPDRVEALILMDTTHAGLDGLPADQVEAAQHVVRTYGTAALGRLLERSEGPLASEPNRRVRETRPGYVAFGDRKMHDASPAMYASMAAQLTSFPDLLPRLAELTMPALVVVGELDVPFRKPSQRMAETLPDARLAVIPEAGHSPQFENPEAWWAAVSEFLRGCR